MARSFRASLTGRGHRVVVLTMGDGGARRTAVRSHPSSRAPPRSPSGTRGLPGPQRGGALRADVIYATATYAAAAAASVIARRPLAVKLVSDPAYERAQRYGLFQGSLEEFQLPAGRPGSRPSSRLGRVLCGARARLSFRVPISRGSGPAGGSATSRSSCSTTLRRGSRLMRCGHQARLPSSGGSRARRTSISRSPLSPGNWRRHGL